MILPVSGAIYLSIKNFGARDDRLLGASSAAATAIEMHESFEQAGVMRMQAHPEGFVVTAGQTLELAPGGKHLMMVEPKALPTAPTASETPSLELTLHFEGAGDLVLQVPVVDPTTVLQSQGASA
jgi:copper(I)-binding protein